MTTATAGSVPPSASATSSASLGASRPSPTTKGGYPLAGVSDPPDPAFHAYRQDLADVALAGRVIASHYAEPLLRHLVAPADLRPAAGEDAGSLARLDSGTEFWLLDDTGGWAWGYGGGDRRVGYIPSAALGL